MEPDVNTFITLDFFDHPTQVSTRQIGRQPKYDTTIQFIVPMDFTFLKYFATSALQLELNQAHGFEFTEIGRSQLQLATVRQDLETTPNVPVRRSLKIHGAADRLIGEVTVRNPSRNMASVKAFVKCEFDTIVSPLHTSVSLLN